MQQSTAEHLAASALGAKMVTMHDIADHLGLSYRTVKEWRELGKLPAPDFKLGKVVRWRADTIEKWIGLH